MPSAPRKLTTHQQAVLIQVLLAFPEQRVAVHYSPAASDALSYARDFLTVFKAVGWRAHEAESAKDVTAPRAGLAIVVSGGLSLPPSAEALRDALRIYGMEVEALCDPDVNMATGDFVLRIGAHA
jgi:hypothetical protein